MHITTRRADFYSASTSTHSTPLLGKVTCLSLSWHRDRDIIEHGPHDGPRHRLRVRSSQRRSVAAHLQTTHKLSCHKSPQPCIPFHCAVKAYYVGTPRPLQSKACALFFKRASSRCNQTSYPRLAQPPVPPSKPPSTPSFSRLLSRLLSPARAPPWRRSSFNPLPPFRLPPEVHPCFYIRRSHQSPEQGGRRRTER